MIPVVDAYRVDDDALRRYPGPSYVGYGALSNERWEAMAERLSHVLADCAVVRYEDRHHADAPHQAEPQRVTAILTSLWKRTDG